MNETYNSRQTLPLIFVWTDEFKIKGVINGVIVSADVMSHVDGVTKASALSAAGVKNVELLRKVVYEVPAAGSAARHQRDSWLPVWTMEVPCK